MRSAPHTGVNSRTRGLQAAADLATAAGTAEAVTVRDGHVYVAAGGAGSRRPSACK